MVKKTILVENVEEDLWNKLVGVAKIEDMKVGHLLNELIFIFLEKKKIIKKGDKLGRKHSIS